MGINPHIRPARVHIGPHALKTLPKTVSNRVLDRQRSKVQALQRAVLGGDFDLERLARREPGFPGNAKSRVVQIALAPVGVMRQLDQHALGQSAVQVQQQGIAPAARQLHPGAPGLGQRAGDALNFLG